MKKKLYLICAGDFGLETEFMLRQNKSFCDEYEIIGFLDDTLRSVDISKSNLKILGTTDYEFTKDEFVLITTSNPYVKESIYNKLYNKVQFCKFISENVLLASNVNIGEGAIIFANTIISINANIGCFVTINFSCRIGHDVVINDFSSLMCNVDIGGHTKIGKKVFLGTSSTIIQKRKIEDNIVVSAGGLVLRNLTKVGTYVGNPVQLIN
jgi:sugar O-acyltransferase (sialic acid O-acetyltransferase NeuD family)